MMIVGHDENKFSRIILSREAFFIFIYMARSLKSFIYEYSYFNIHSYANISFEFPIEFYRRTYTAVGAPLATGMGLAWLLHQLGRLGALLLCLHRLGTDPGPRRAVGEAREEARGAPTAV